MARPSGVARAAVNGSRRFASVLRFCKALSEGNRLRALALLSTGEMTVEQLADRLGLGSSTVSHHLSRLADAGLVTARAEGYYSIYRLDDVVMRSAARHLLDRDTLPAIAADVEAAAFDRKVLRTYVQPDGRIRAFPKDRAMGMAVLRHVARAFEPGRFYSGPEVDATLVSFGGDAARLRRRLVAQGFIGRAGAAGAYRLTGA